MNADYRPPHSPEPAFDWVTYPELQKSKDRTLQESVAFYDPSVKVVVFVFLPSKSGNSLAIWRRKIEVPSGVRLAYQAQITQAIAGLSKDYVVHVDEYVVLAGLVFVFVQLISVLGYFHLPAPLLQNQRNASGGNCGYLLEYFCFIALVYYVSSV